MLHSFYTRFTKAEHVPVPRSQYVS